jgi:Spy/CpxP family protein refolding chaperone
MRPAVTRLLALALAALAAGTALAQLVSGRIPALQNGIEAPLLLMNKGVQEELKMTPEQIGKFRKIIKDSWDKFGGDLQKARRDKDEKKYLQLVQQSTQETREKVNKAIPEVLQPAQVKRLREIEIQVNGIASFHRPEVQKELNLTDEQKKDIKSIDDGLRQDIAEVFKDPEIARRPLIKGPEAARKAKALTDEATKKALAVLDSDQKKKWEKMTGEKFNFKIELREFVPGRP